MAQDPAVLLPSVGTAPSHLSLEILYFDKPLLKLCLLIKFFPSRNMNRTTLVMQCHSSAQLRGIRTCFWSLS